MMHEERERLSNDVTPLVRSRPAGCALPLYLTVFPSRARMKNPVIKGKFENDISQI